MNATKWWRLFHEIEPLRASLDFLRRDVLDEADPERWNADIYEMFGLCERIEWMEIRAALTTQRGAFVPTQGEDFSDALKAAAARAGAPFEVTTHGIRVWGYVAPSQQIEWHKSAP